jgi:hypothetical protein
MDLPFKVGGSDTKKIENFPRILRFKISSLQLPAVAHSPSQKNADSGCIPPVSGGGVGSLGNFSDPGNLNAVNA